MISEPSTRPPKASKILEEKIRVVIHPEYPEQTIAIGSTLTKKRTQGIMHSTSTKLRLVYQEASGYDGRPTKHCVTLLEYPGGMPTCQAKEKRESTGKKQSNLRRSGKTGGCRDHERNFKDLNNACPKDCYPLPEIDWKIKSLCGYPFKCFLDAYKGYHQIKMAKEDEEKMAFTTSQRISCYSKMPFGLKNVEATYQRLVDKAFQRQIGRNLEVYVDDLVIKSRTEEEIIRDITKTFKTLREINMKLNPRKCSFGMQEGMFLGYKVNTGGLKVCTEESDAVLSFPSPRCLKDVQKLNGKLARGRSSLQTNEELIAELPMLTAPKEKEELIVYLAAAKEAISAVLMTDREGKQVPVYFVSRALRGPEINYTPMEKLVLALLSASKRLKRYFQAHTIVVITDQPIKQLLSSSEISGRMLKWKFELEGYDIQYRPRTSIKGQIQADFIVERPEEKSPDEPMTEPEEILEPWTLFTDGSSCIDGSGVGLILTNPEGVEFTYAMRFTFEATNNEAEYEALIAGLRIA
ncbi:reverse transcriptase domain-containing protein [Tanacetum coccineum]